MNISTLTTILIAVGLTATAFVSNAPENLPYLWVLKAAASSFVGVGAWLMQPPGTVPAVSQPDKLAAPAAPVGGLLTHLPTEEPVVLRGSPKAS